MNPSSLYFVPSHRVVPTENMLGFLAESNFATTRVNSNVPLVFFDDYDGDDNRHTLTAASFKYGDVTTYYFRRSNFNELLSAVRERLSPGARASTEQLALKPEINYGNTLNKMFVTALLFGVEKLHRRDMDVLMPTHDQTGEVLYPIERELDALGREIDGKVTYIAGGGYRGKFNLDIEPFAADRDFVNLKQLFSLMSIPSEDHDAIIEKEYLACNEPLIEDRVKHNTGQYPECGNYSLYRLFEQLPCPTLPLALGTDYFPTEAAVHAGLSVTYHYRAVRHRHTACRYDSFEKSLAYWKGLARLIDLQVMYRSFFQRFVETEPVMALTPTLGRSLARAMQRHLPAFLGSAVEREGKFRGYCSLIAQSNIPLAPQIAQDLERTRQECRAQVEQGIVNHIQLLQAWPEVVAATAWLRRSGDATRLLESCRLS